MACMEASLVLDHTRGPACHDRSRLRCFLRSGCWYRMVLHRADGRASLDAGHKVDSCPTPLCWPSNPRLGTHHKIASSEHEAGTLPSGILILDLCTHAVSASRLVTPFPSLLPHLPSHSFTSTFARPPSPHCRHRNASLRSSLAALSPRTSNCRLTRFLLVRILASCSRHPATTSAARGPRLINPHPPSPIARLLLPGSLLSLLQPCVSL
jgi:hypothetical protein